MILRPRLIVQATCVVWVSFMGLALYGSAIWTNYENFAVASDHDRGNGVQPGLDGGGIGTLPSTSGRQERPSLPGNPVRSTNRNLLAKSGAPGLALESRRQNQAPVAGRDSGSATGPSVVRAHGVRHVPAPSDGRSLLETGQGSLRNLATAQARRCKVPAWLLHRQIARESSWNPDAISSSGARGLMQLLPRYHSHPLLDIDDPQTNLSIAACYLRRLIERRRGNVRAALMDYVGGQNRVRTTQAHREYAADILGTVGQ